MVKVGTEDNVGDAFTKMVSCPKFKYYMKVLGVGVN